MLQGLGTNSVWVASAIDGLIRVVFFSIYASVVDDELERIVHETTIAALVVRPVTIDELLLGQRDQVPRDNLVDTLHSSNCRECPATPFSSNHIARHTKLYQGMLFNEFLHGSPVFLFSIIAYGQGIIP